MSTELEGTSQILRKPKAMLVKVEASGDRRVCWVSTSLSRIIIGPHEARAVCFQHVDNSLTFERVSYWLSRLASGVFEEM